MEVFQTILHVIFIINCFFLILIILLQSGRSSGMNLFGGGSQTPFGAGSADVLTKSTGVMAAIFLVLGLFIAYLETSQGSQVEELKQEFAQQENASAPESDNETSNDQAKIPTTQKKEGSETPIDSSSNHSTDTAKSEK